MPIDYQQIYTRIKEIGAGAKERRKKKEESQTLAYSLLDIYDSQLDELRAKVDTVKQFDPNIRCAVPLDEDLKFSYHPPLDSLGQITLIAADGSQSVASRHDPIQFCIINIGAIIMKLNSGDTTYIDTETDLYYGIELETYGLNTDGGVAIKRDLSERKIIEKLARDIAGPIILLTDGTMDIYRPRDIENINAYQDAISEYITILSRLQSKGTVIASYIDKPVSSLVIKLLEIAQATIPDDLEKIKNNSPLQNITDRWLFGYQNTLFQLLPPGHRSAVFGIQSNSEKKYTGVLSLHFFYLNVGTEGHPWPVRVEIPKWVVDDKSKLDLLHGVLVEQCRMMGSKPYPYLLHRAHETAVVKNEEKQQIENMLAMELRRQDEEVDLGSHKSSAKGLKGRRKR